MRLFGLMVLGAAVGAGGTRGIAQQAGDSGARIVQPGAPGQQDKTLTPATAEAAVTPRPPTSADISFMQGMIMHHNQAVEMTELLKTRSADPEVREMGNKISVSQTDEMRYMKQWLADRGIPESSMSGMDHGAMDHSSMTGADHSSMSGMDHGAMDHSSIDHSSMEGMDHSSMAGMDHSSMSGMDHSHMSGMEMGGMPAMPGMLTEAQMNALRAAKGPQFDHLFLTGMIQHHTGALTMVKQLFDNPDAGQDPQLFDFANDVDGTQLAEIKFMKILLAKEKQ